MSSKLLHSIIHDNYNNTTSSNQASTTTMNPNRSSSNTGNQQNSNDNQIAILSPPLSPYPKSISQQNPSSAIISSNHHTSLSNAAATGSSSSSAGPGNIKEGNNDHFIGTKKPTALHNEEEKETSLSLKDYKICKLNPNKPMVSSAWSQLKQDPVGYYNRERSYLDLYPRNGPTWSNYVYLNQGDSNAATSQANLPPVQKSKLTRKRKRRFQYVTSDVDSSDNAMITRSQRTTTQPSSRNNNNNNNNSNTPTRSRNSTPKPKSSSSHHHRSANSPAAPASKVHDLEYEDVTDYCPSVDTLPPGKSLKADWKGAPMDLSGDPEAKDLHPAELHLASVLRLSARLYLDSKRRLFAEKVHRMRHGLPFRRTDSQKACRIDVNKASRLFSAFERVGWLEDKMFTKFLN